MFIESLLCARHIINVQKHLSLMSNKPFFETLSGQRGHYHLRQPIPILDAINMWKLFLY